MNVFADRSNTGAPQVRDPQRHWFLRATAFAFALLLLAGFLASLAQLPSTHAQAQFLTGARRLQPANYNGSAHATGIVGSRKASALSLAAGDFDVDGYDDLAVGLSAPQGGIVAFHRGDVNAFAPQDQATLDAIANNNFPSPYLPDAQLVEIPERPDFLAAGDFTGIAGPGVVAASRNGQALYVIARGPSGVLDLEQTVQVPGRITALAGHALRPTKYENVVVGVHGDQGSQLLLYTGSADGLTLEAAFPLPSDAASFAFGKMDADPVACVLVIAGGQPLVFHTGRQTLEPLTVPFNVVAADLGHFLPDRVSLNQMALLSDDGTLHIWAHSNINSTPLTSAELAGRSRLRVSHGLDKVAEPAFMSQPIVWKEMETVANAGPPNSDGRTPIMFRTRVSNSPMDDVLLMSSSKTSVVAHPAKAPLTAQQTDRWDLAANVAAAIPARVNIDGRPGIVFVAQGDFTPQTIDPASNATYTPNRTDDPAASAGSIGSYCNGVSNDCSLRQAILKANADSGTDTIRLSSTTYTLTQARNGSDDGTTGTLQVFANMNIVGNGTNNTIIQGGTATGPSCDTNHACNDVDLVLAVNEDVGAGPLSNSNVSGYSNATASLSNFTIQNGFNRGDVAGIQDGFGGGLDFDTGLSGLNTITLTNVNLKNNSAAQGGAFNAFNFQGGSQNDPTGPATVTLSNVVIQSNAAYPVISGENTNWGGGFATDVQSRPVLTNCIVTGNTATYNGTGGNNGQGGGLYFNGSGNTAFYKIHSSLISGNSATESGGGIYLADNFVIDTGSSLTGNSQTVGTLGGGGIDIGAGSSPSASISNVNFSGNSAVGYGGAIFGDVLPSSGLTISYSRFVGNTAPLGGANAWSQGGAYTFTNDWWGTNTLATIQGTIGLCSGCNPAASSNIANYLELAVNPSASSVTVGGTATTSVTAGFLKNNTGATISASNLAALSGLAATFGATKGTANPSSTTVGDSVAIATASESGNTVTINTSAVHGFSNGQSVYISGVGSGYDGQYTVANSGSTSFQYTSAATTLPTLGAGGTAAVPTGVATTTFTGTRVGLGSVIGTVDNFTATSANIVVNSDTTTAGSNNPTATFSESSQNVTPTATISASSGDTVAGGTVTFTIVDGSNTTVSTCTSATVSGGSASATCAIPANTHAGTYFIHSSYSGTTTGNGDFELSSDTTGNHTFTISQANTTTSASSQTAGFSASNQNVTLTANVSSPAGAVNEGTVTFTVLNGGTPVGTATTSGTVSAGSASVSYNIPANTPTGTYIIQAVFNGSTDFTGSSDNTHTLTINAATTTTASNATATFSSSSQPVTLVAGVQSAAGTVNAGTVSFSVFNGGTQIGASTSPANVSSNLATATYTLPAGTSAGTYTIVATYTGAGGFSNSSDNTHTLTVNPASTTTTSSNQTVTFSESSQNVTLAANVASGGGTVGAGTVTFTVLNGGTPVGTATTSGTVSNGSASVNYSIPASTAAGNYTIQAVYNGSANFAGSSDNSHTLTVNNANTTTTAVNATIGFSASNQNVTLNASVTSGAGAVNVGTVTFTLFNGGTPVGVATTSGTVNNGSAGVTYSVPGGTSSGTYIIQAVYNAGPSFNTSSDNTHRLTVNSASTTTAASNANMAFGSSAQSVTLTAGVTSGAGTVNAGTVTFTVLNGGTPVGTATTSGAVTNGSASVNYTIPANTPTGTYTLQAVYNGAAGFNGSSDNAHTLTVTNASTSTAAQNATAGFSSSSQVVALHATVTATTGSGSVNAGTVTFTVFNSSSQIVGTATTSGTISGGAATVNYTLPAGLVAGTYTIQAVYSGAAGYNGSSDSIHTLTVSGGPTATQASNASASFNNSAQNVTLQASVSSIAGTVNAGTVTFTVVNSSSQIVGTPTTSGTVTNGAASVSYSIPGGALPGTYTIQAVYNGAGGFTGSSDSTHTLTVSAAGSTVSASNAVTVYSPSNQNVNLSATVTSLAGTVNGGTVTFTILNGATPVGAAVTSSAVANGAAAVSYTIPGGTLAGTYTLQAVYSGSSNFNGALDNTHTLGINRATPIVTWSNPASISFGGALSGSQLNAAANVPGTFVYTPPAGTVLPVGNNQTLSVLFTPTDATDYNAATQTAQISVLASTSPATLVLTQTLARDSGTGDVIVTLTLADTGGSPATAVVLNSAKIGSTAALTALPLAVADVPGGGASTVTLTFPASVGTSGARAVLSIQGTYSGGAFGGSSRVVLP